MKRWLILLFLPAMVSADGSSSRDFAWLEGCWVTADNRAQEVWVIDDKRSLVGFAVSIKDSKLGSYELLSIKQAEDGSWIYTAHPSGQKPASFQAEEMAKNSVVFANPDHDFPQEIRYLREGKRLSATISMLGGVDAVSFEKVACE
ncbi:MAG: hypothetical protein GWP69_20935 [Gammaproteobacteria bacterium]|nr:hypothetical protein [Gammaproteobacteria bacterium]